MQIKVYQPIDCKAKALVYGPSGIGKTVLGGTAPNPIFASAESGLLSVSDKKVSFVEIKSLKDLQDLYIFLKNGGHTFETVVIDSITEINDIIKMEIERKSGKTMQLQDWGDLSRKIKSILRQFRDLPMHVLFLAQETSDKDEEKIERILPSLNGRSSTDIASFMDIVGYMYIDKTGNRKMITSTNAKLITKDRSNKIGNNTEIDFSVWVEKIKGIKTGEQKITVDTEPEDVVEQPQKPVDTKPTPPTTTDTPKKTAEKKIDTPTETVAEPAKTEPQAVETSPDVQTPAPGKLPANKVKEVQAKWKEFAEKKGWKQEESDKRKKATLNKYYQIESVNELTVERADDFVSKLDKAIESIVY